MERATRVGIWLSNNLLTMRSVICFGLMSIYFSLVSQFPIYHLVVFELMHMAY